MRVIIQGNWAPYVGTDYCDVLGLYESLEAAKEDARCYAEERWEAPDEEESGIEDEGPDYWVEEYDPDKHDMLSISGSFAYAFEQMEK